MYPLCTSHPIPSSLICLLTPSLISRPVLACEWTANYKMDAGCKDEDGKHTLVVSLARSLTYSQLDPCPYPSILPRTTTTTSTEYSVLRSLVSISGDPDPDPGDAQR